MSLARPTWRWHGLGLALAVLQVWLLVATHEQVGIPRDESFYLHAADKIAAWVERFDAPGVESFSKAEIAKGFSYNREHPALMKTLFGVSHLYLHDKWEWVEDSLLAYRMPTMLLAGLAVWLAFLLGLMLHSPLAGALGAAALICMPRVYFHNHLACFDGPVTAMWLLICYTFLRATRSRRWAIACGLALGLGMSTKLNVFFLPFVLLAVAAIDSWTFKRRTGAWRAPDGERGPLQYYTWIAVSMLVLGAAVFFAHWPWLWHETGKRLGFYIGFHARHVHYPVDYLGHLYYEPPFPMHLPLVFTALSVPVSILVLGAIGLWQLAKAAWRGWRTPGEDRSSAEVMVLANFLAPIAIIALPFTPVFGGTKHWMPAMPFLAVAAGIGAVWVGQGLFARWPRYCAAATAALGVAMLAPAFWATLTYGGHGPTYYNALAGGPAGAAQMRMPRDFWGYGSVKVLPYLNEHAERGALSFWHNATGWAVQRYQRNGWLREDIRVTGDWTIPWSDWAIYHDAREKLPEELDIWRDYRTRWPVDGYFVDGVQTIGVYRRPPRAP